MPIHNADIQRLFQELADLLEIEGANPFRARAYRNAARTVTGLSESIADKVKKQEDLTGLQGIGKDLAEKMKEIVQTGSLQDLEEARKRVSPELASLLKISGLGPKKVKALHEQLGITSIQDLQQAAQSGKISDLSGFGSKTESSILEELERFSSREERFTLDAVEAVVQSLESFLESLSSVNQEIGRAHV